MPDLVVEIAVGVSVHKTFHYRYPPEMQGQLYQGSRVLVPFGSRRVPGTVVGFPDQSHLEDLKPVLEILENPLSPDLFELACWMSDYYLYPLGQTIEAVVPKAVSRAKPKLRKYLRLSDSADPGRASGQVKGRKQSELIRLLAEQGETAIELLPGFSRTTIKSLIDAGIAEIAEREQLPGTEELDFSAPIPPTLMPEQLEAVARIGSALAQHVFTVFLLHGVTASGKTEVYLRAIAELTGTGKGTIVLVPEIALTPQLLSRFRRRFGARWQYCTAA